jgi:hypothetical protein
MPYFQSNAYIKEIVTAIDGLACSIKEMVGVEGVDHESYVVITGLDCLEM